MTMPDGAKVRKELINRTTNTFREAKNTDPELVINLALIFLLQLLLFKFLIG
ncbi:MAG: hypothetical protein RRB13_03980 [bacterium]|nr:hypothetical protein [bacterium]